jgi:hypothetical protein
MTGGARWRATVALARFESPRLLRHPVSIVAAVLFLAPWAYGWVFGSADRYPVLQDLDRLVQFVVVLLLGGAALIVANLAILRPHRHGTTGQEDVLVLPVPWRTAALLLALLPFGLGVALLVALRIGVSAALPGAAGRPDPFELAVGPVAVVLLGAVGVLLGRLGQTTVVAPLLLLGLGSVTFVQALPDVPGAKWLRWLLPIAFDADSESLPVALMHRPTARHLGYVVAVVAVVVGLALLVSGARGRRPVGLLAAALALAAALGAVQFVPAGAALTRARMAATDNPAAQQSCQRIDQVTYCAFPDYVPWVGAWDAVVRGVLRRLPAEEARKPLAVRQRVWAYGRPEGSVTYGGGEEQDARAQVWRQADLAAGTPNAVTVGTRWGDGRSEVGFAGLVAYEIMARKGAGVNGLVCGTRGVMVAWLAGQATPATAAGLRAVDASSMGGITFTEPSFDSGITVDDREIAVALALLARPADEVMKVVLAAWAELSAAETPIERAGELFGVAVPPAPPEQEASVCTA